MCFTVVDRLEDRMEEEDHIRKRWDLERDLANDPEIIDKIRNSEIYRQNLYAALCNNEFQPQHLLPQLAEYTWSCSWRYAGGLIAAIYGEGDYMDYYCSGIGTFPLKEEDPANGFVSESVITDEVRADLNRLGWNIIETDENIFR